MKDKKKKDKDKKQQVLDIDFIETTYGPIVVHRYKDKPTKNRPY
ncbi:hypothetical protein [Oceanirhabdus seepicola]|nr:hypothetical protein [Oceanirhabdus seepicola]